MEEEQKGFDNVNIFKDITNCEQTQLKVTSINIGKGLWMYIKLYHFKKF